RECRNRFAIATADARMSLLSSDPPEAPAERVEVPTQVFRQPTPETEARVSRHPIGPGARHLRDAPPGDVSLDHGLHSDLKAPGTLEVQIAEVGRTVHLERIGDVRSRYAREPVQRNACGSGEEPLQERAADLLAPSRIPR